MSENQALSVLPPAELLQAIQVISPTVRDFIENAVRRAVTMDVTTDEELAQAAECLNSLTKGQSTMKAAVTEARRPVIAFADALSASVAPLDESAKEAKGILADKIKLYQDEQEAKRQKALAEQRRLEEEARQKAEAERQAREKAAKEAQAKAEAIRREQERLQWEAQERERIAAKAIMEKGNKTGEDVTANAKALEEAAELDRKAEQARLDAEEAEYLAQQAAEEAAKPVAVAVVQPMPQQTVAKAKGVKTKRQVEGLKMDVAKLPAAYLTANETLLKRHILDGAVTKATPGVLDFQIIETLTGTGR